jgi:hypothetical protein
MKSLLLDSTYGYLHLKGAWHLAYYIPAQKDDPSTFSGRLLQFKNADPESIRNWTCWSVANFEFRKPKCDCVIRALGSKELKITEDKPLDILGSNIADTIGCPYNPTILIKNRPTKSLHLINKRADRIAELSGSYEVANKTHDLNWKTILVIDDIGTANTTLSEIMRAIRVQWPRSQFSYFCLGRTSYDPSANDEIPHTYFRN